MTPEDIERVCRQTGLRNDGLMQAGLHVAFHDGRAVSIEIGADFPLSFGGEPLTSRWDDNVARLMNAICPPAADWTEREGLVAFHWESSDRIISVFRVYAPGWRYPIGPPPGGK
jgi:hypothetical protein